MIINKTIKSKKVFGVYLEYKDENGNRKQIKKFGNNTWSKAEALAQETIELKQIEQLKESYLKFKDGSFKTLDEVFKEYINSNRQVPLKEVTKYDVTNFVNLHILVDELKNMKMKDISVNNIREWQNNLLNKRIDLDNRSNKGGQPYSNAQLMKIQTYFKSILSYAVKHKYISDNPFDVLNIAQRPEGIKKAADYQFINVDQYRKLINVINLNTNKERRLQDRVIFSILFWVGLRKNELVALNCGDYDVSNKTLKIYKSWNNKQFILTSPKTNNSNRELIVVDEVHRAIMELFEYYKELNIYHDDLPLITNNGKLSSNLHDKDSGRLASTTLDRYRDQYFEKAKLKVIRIHDFRHSCATYLLNHGQEMFQVARYLGDTVTTLESVYAHIEKKKQSEMINHINNLSNNIYVSAQV